MNGMLDYTIPAATVSPWSHTSTSTRMCIWSVRTLSYNPMYVMLEAMVLQIWDRLARPIRGLTSF